MKKSDLVKEMGARRGMRPADAADEVDGAVNELIKALKQGKVAKLPGLGTIAPERPWKFNQEGPQNP